MSIIERARQAARDAEAARQAAIVTAVERERIERHNRAHDHLWKIIDDPDADINFICDEGSLFTYDVFGSTEDEQPFRVRVHVPVSEDHACSAVLLCWSSSTGRWYDNSTGFANHFHDLETLGIVAGKIIEHPELQLHEEAPHD